MSNNTLCVEQHYQRWNETGLKNIKPSSLRYGEYPEGWDVLDKIQRIISPFINHRVLELGCGYGRLCSAFPPKKYLGVDINTRAIEKAKTLFPKYQFQHIPYTSQYPSADVVLAYTVFLHIPEENIHEILKGFDKAVEHLIIGEIMEDKEWDTNRDHNYDVPDKFHAVYQRTPEQYEKMLAQHDFYLHEGIIKPYYYYPNAKIHILHFRKKPLAPSSLKLPESLNNPHLKMEGIFDDGWVAPEFSIAMHNQKGGASFFIEGFYPQIDSNQPKLILEIKNQSETLLKAEIKPGEFKLKSQGRLPEGQYCLQILTNSTVSLPSPDNRHIGFLLKKLEFQS